MSIQKKNPSKKKIGRPPARWVHELANLTMQDDVYLEYADLAKRFRISERSLRGFCSQQNVEGEFYVFENSHIRKRFKVGVLRHAAKAYLREQQVLSK